MIFILLATLVFYSAFWFSKNGFPFVAPGFRLPDARDFLEGRTSRRREFGLPGNPRLDALMSLSALRQETTDEVPGSSLQEITHHAIFAFSNAFFMNILVPDSLLWNLCWFPVLSPMSLVHIWIGLTIAHTDRRDVANINYADSIITFIVYLGTLLARRLIPILRHLILHLIHFIWTNVASVSTSCAIICALLYVIKIPPSWASSTREFANWLNFSPIIDGTNVVFITVTTTTALWRHIGSATRIMANVIWKTTMWNVGKIRASTAERILLLNFATSRKIENGGGYNA